MMTSQRVQEAREAVVAIVKACADAEWGTTPYHPATDRKHARDVESGTAEVDALIAAVREQTLEEVRGKVEGGRGAGPSGDTLESWFDDGYQSAILTVLAALATLEADRAE